MLNHYGPTIILGLMISSAIILDDLIIVSMHGEHHPAMKQVHIKKHKVSQGHAEEVLEVTEHKTTSPDTQRMLVRVNGEDADFPVEAVEQAIRSAIDAAEKAGRAPTPEELDEAIQSATHRLDAKDLDIDIEIDN
jgi:hypothetical protein